MATPKGIYPFATQDGQAIPLDIISPAGLIRKSFISAASSVVVLPEGYSVGVFYSSTDVLVSFGADHVTLADGAVSTDTMLVPAGTLVTAAFNSGNAYVKGLASSGDLYIQLIEKWAGLALNTQYVRK